MQVDVKGNSLYPVYRPEPNNETMSKFLEEYSTLLEEISVATQDIVILDDFNIHMEVNNSTSAKFNDIITGIDLVQHVLEPTNQESGHPLDLVMSKSNDFVSGVETCEYFSDTFNIQSKKLPSRKRIIKSRNYHNMDPNAFVCEITSYFSNIQPSASTCDLWKCSALLCVMTNTRAATLLTYLKCFISMPSSFTSMPSSFISMHGSFISMHGSFISMPGSFISIPSSFISMHGSFISMFYINGSFISMPGSFISMPSSFISMQCLVVLYQSSFISW